MTRNNLIVSNEEVNLEKAKEILLKIELKTSNRR